VETATPEVMPVDDPWAAEALHQVRVQQTHVLLRLGQGRYAVPLSSVDHVLQLPVLTRVPGGPIWLAGAANWRGRVLPVLDVRPLLGVERSALAGSARVLVLAEGEVRAGVIVESVLGLLDDPGTEFEAVPPTVTPAAASILEGVVESSGPIGLLDVSSVLGLRGQLRQTRPAW
jgi:purine-binding chemotaxis protein CheW